MALPKDESVWVNNSLDAVAQTLRTSARSIVLRAARLPDHPWLRSAADTLQSAYLDAADLLESRKVNQEERDG